MDPRMMRQDMGGRRPSGMERAAPPAPPINPAPRMSPQMPAIDAELNRDVFPDPPSWRNYIPEEQRELNSIPTSQENIISMLNQLRHYESLPGVGDWRPFDLSVRELDTDPEYGPPDSYKTFLKYNPEGYRAGVNY